tara:strand:+ start:208 stop:402 length:195 start_codon:yes stop_codon:yes gene_type:complete
MGYKLYSSAEYQRMRYYSGGWRERISKQSLASYHKTKDEKENRPTKMEGFNNLIKAFQFSGKIK